MRLAKNGATAEKFTMRIVYTLLLFFIYQWTFNEGWEVWEQVLLLLPLVLIGVMFERSKRGAAQAERDANASEISRSLNPDGRGSRLSPEDEAIENELEEWMSDDPPPMNYLADARAAGTPCGTSTIDLPLALYLRAFAFDGKILVPNPDISRLLYWTWFPYRSTVLEKINLEELLTLGVGGQASFVAIGRPGEVHGAGKVLTTDAEWRGEFVRLATSASLVCSVPALYESTLWELEWLAQHQMFEKTLMIFTALHTAPEEEKFRLEALRKKLAEYGWHLPDNLSTSSFVLFNRDGSIKRHYPGTRFRKSEIAGIVAQSLEHSRARNGAGFQPLNRGSSAGGQ